MRFVDEYLKTEGLIDSLSRSARLEVNESLREFFAGRTCSENTAGRGSGTIDQMKSAVQDPTAPRPL
jgi:hypothetical protein